MLLWTFTWWNLKFKNKCSHLLQMISFLFNLVLTSNIMFAGHVSTPEESTHVLHCAVTSSWMSDISHHTSSSPSRAQRPGSTSQPHVPYLDFRGCSWSFVSLRHIVACPSRCLLTCVMLTSGGADLFRTQLLHSRFTQSRKSCFGVSRHRTRTQKCTHVPY